LLSSERIEEPVMSQPPDPDGGEPGRPARPRRPGEPGPDGPPQAYARPPYGTAGGPYPDPFGLPPRPKKRNLLPWLVVGGALVLFGLGLLLVLLLTRDGGTQGGQGTRVTVSSDAPSSPAADLSPPAATGNLPGGARVAEAAWAEVRSGRAGTC
jgi:hypothetical protein